MKRALIMTMLAAVTAAAGIWATTLMPRSPDPAPLLDRDGETAGRLPPPIDPDRAAGQRGEPIAVGRATNPVLITELDGGQRIEIRGRDVRPVAADEYALTQPQALIFLDRHSALVLEAREARIVAPDGRPIFGQMVGPDMGLRMSLYEAPDGVELDIDRDSPHLQVACYLEDAEVDLQLGQVRSRGPVELRSPRVTFRGTGLDLTYNSFDRRIERLVVLQGRDLLIRPADKADPAAPAEQPRAQPRPRRDRQAGQADPQMPPFWYRARFHEDVAIATGEYRTQGGEQLTIYFSSLIGRDGAGMFTQRVAQARRGSTLRSAAPGKGAGSPIGGADERGLTAKCHYSRENITSASLAMGSGLGPVAGVALAGLWSHVAPIAAQADSAAPADPAADALPLPVPPDPPLLLEGAGPEPGDIYLTWRGALEVDPVEQPPLTMQGRDEVFASLQRVDVTASPPDGGQRRLLARRLDYHSLTGRVRAVGSGDQPLRVSAPSLGTLHGLDHGREAQIVFEPDEGRGLWIGPGMLRTLSEPPGDDADLPLSLPPGLRMAWQQRVEMRFADREAGAAETGLDATLDRAVDSVDFIGEVRTRHRDFTIDAGRLALHLSEPVDGRQDVRRFHASRGARLMTREVGHRMPMTVSGQAIDLQMSRDPRGIMQPRHFTATGQVHATLPSKTLESGTLELTLDSHEQVTREAARRAAVDQPRILPPQQVPDDPFDPFPAEPLPGEDDDDRDRRDAAPGHTRLVVRTLDAAEDVRIELDDRGTRIRGDRIVADSVLGRLDLWGSNDRPARLERGDGWISGVRIIMLEDEGTVEVPGPGSLELVSQGDTDALADGDGDGDQRHGVAADGRPRDEAEPTVNFASWQRQMHFDNLRGEAQFGGDVYFRATESTRLRQFWTDDLHLAFTPADRDGAAAPPRDPEAGDDALTRAATARPFAAGEQRRRILELHARQGDGQAIFLEEDYADRVGGRLIRRARLAGPDIHYDDIEQQLIVRGRGSFFFQDLVARAEADRPPGERGGGDRDRHPAPMAGISGPGDTLFNWDGLMRLDLRANDVRLSRSVAMSHRPLDRSDTFHLHAAEVYADFAPRGSPAARGAVAQNGDGDGDGEAPRLRVVRADGEGLDERVRVISPQRELICDQMVYHARGGRIRMLSAEDRWVQIITEGDPTMATARRVVWDIETDRIEISEPGPTFTAPRPSDDPR